MPGIERWRRKRTATPTRQGLRTLDRAMLARRNRPAHHNLLAKESPMTSSNEPHSESKDMTGNEAFILNALSDMTSTLIVKIRRVSSHTRLAFGLRGLLAVAIGIGVILWPSNSLAAMAIV